MNSGGYAAFTETGGRFIPSEWARGPWSEGALAGGAVGALLARRLERSSPVGKFLARFSLQLLGVVPFEPLAPVTDHLRSGRSYELMDCCAVSDDGQVRARAFATFTENRVRPPVALPDWDDFEPPPHEEATMGLSAARAQQAGFWNLLQFGRSDGSPLMSGNGPVWFRFTGQLIAGEGATPLQCLVTAADFAYGVIAPIDVTQASIVNIDLHIQLCRPPSGGWIGISGGTYFGDLSCGACSALVADERGVIGTLAQTLLVL